MQMGPTMTSYNVCRAAGCALVPRGVASGCFASANILLKSFVEQKGALSAIKRCTAYRSLSLCLCSLPAFATRVPGSLPSGPKVPPLLLTFALFFAGASAASSLEFALDSAPV